MSGAPLFLKLVKPIKVACSWAANQFRISQLLIVETKSQMRAAHTSVLRETDSAMGKEVAGFNLADGGLNELSKLSTLVFIDGSLQILNFGRAFSDENDESNV
jgi:hypothetical protein